MAGQPARQHPLGPGGAGQGQAGPLFVEDTTSCCVVMCCGVMCCVPTHTCLPLVPRSLVTGGPVALSQAPVGPGGTVYGEALSV